MSVKLNVSKLREELAKRSLDTTGLKPALVSRLDTAIADEEAEKPAAAPAPDASQDARSSRSGSKAKNGMNESGKEDKRKRIADPSIDEDDAKPLKRLKAVEVSKLSVADLKAALSDRGLQTTGVKKDLVQRLSDAVEAEDNDTKDDGQADGGKTGKEPEKKMVVAVKKGRAVLDQYLPDNIKQGFHVFEQNGTEIFDAMLNQTNVGDNNNKFYVIQLLEADSGGQYYVYTRWGRVGVKGQDKLFGPYSSSDQGIAEFHGKFFDKTKNQWWDRHNFVGYPKKYTWLEMDYEEKDDDKKSEEEDKREAATKMTKSVVPKQSKLDKRVEDFVNLICNINMMKQMMMEIGYDARKMPLGKLSKSTILKGYEVLKDIAAALEDKSTTTKGRATLQQLSSEFYTVIPHDFGFKKMQNFIIDTVQKLKMKLEMVEALGEIELATKLLSNDSDEDDDPAYTHYKRLNCELEPIDNGDQEFDMIRKYVEKTHGQTHAAYKLELLQVFKTQRDGEADRFQPFGKSKNRMLLWHGSRLSNWTGILSQGLRIAPPEAPVSGYMFGKGVYFADMVSKSANYCYTSHTDPVGVLLLCEVALGNMRELYDADYHADNLPAGKLSTKGIGRTAPNPKEYTNLEDGVVVPSGRPLDRKDVKASLQYNEYIVYNPAQIRMRYLLQVRFNYLI